MQEKIFTDCVKCEHFRRCGQYAMVAPIDAPSAVQTLPLLRQGFGGQAQPRA
jgi:hypothetical protein